MIRFISVVLVLSYPAQVLCDSEEICDEQAYDDESSPPNFDCPSPGEDILNPYVPWNPTVAVSEGEEFTAPWDGAFVDIERIIVLGLKLKSIRRLRWADRVRLSSEHRLRLEHAEQTLAATKRHATSIQDYYADALDKANARAARATAWYRSWAFGFLMGVVSAGLLAALGVYIGFMT